MKYSVSVYAGVYIYQIFQKNPQDMHIFFNKFPYRRPVEYIFLCWTEHEIFKMEASQMVKKHQECCEAFVPNCLKFANIMNKVSIIYPGPWFIKT